jgi:hypothetical protein
MLYNFKIVKIKLNNNLKISLLNLKSSLYVDSGYESEISDL